MIVTSRATRLVRATDLRAFREAVVSLACEGSPLAARDRIVVVPSRAAAALLTRSIEARFGPGGGAALLPDMVTSRELVRHLAGRLRLDRPVLTDAEREVLLGVACRDARESGADPPFRLRPALVSEMLRLYDTLRWNQNPLDAFERLALGRLEPGAGLDRGAERLVRQTRFLVAAFREFERRSEELGADEHQLRRRLMSEPAPRPFRHVVVTVSDQAVDPHGLYAADWDLLTRVPGLERLDVVVTDSALAGTLHERMHSLLPGIEEVRIDAGEKTPGPILAVPSDGAMAYTARDREEEVADFARRTKRAVRGDGAEADRIALVVQQPLPYVYVAREIFRSAGIPCQMFDALPLAAEPYAAAIDLIFAAVSGSFARVPAIALLRSPHFRFTGGPAEAGYHEGLRFDGPAEAGHYEGLRSDGPAEAGHYVRLRSDGPAEAGHYEGLRFDGPAEAGHYVRLHSDGPPKAAHQEGHDRNDSASYVVSGFSRTGTLAARDVAALDRALSEAGYLGEAAALESLVGAWRAQDSGGARHAGALEAAGVLLGLVRELDTLRSPAPTAEHLTVVLTFLDAHQHLPHADDPAGPRQLRARGAVLGTLGTLRDAYARFDPAPVAFDEVAALVRRWIDSHTFAPRTGETGVHLVDADSAAFGDFHSVQLAGLVDGEWPERPRRNIFYPPEILRELGWPSEVHRRDAVRARFRDLLGLPSGRVSVSTFSLEADAIVSPSMLLDELDPARFDTAEDAPPASRIFEVEALGLDPVVTQTLGPLAREWAAHRLAAPGRRDRRFRGATAPHRAAAFSLSALERYQDCPFKFFAADVLRLEEEPEDESALSPRARGRFVHEVFQRFFEAWDARHGGTITPARMDAARALSVEVAEPLLARLPEAEAAIERARLFGSAISMGAVDVVLGLEASRPVDVLERWLEYRLEGDFSLGATTGAHVSLKGVADRIDLLPGRRLRVIDYKSGSAPNVRRALQVPIYALCARERLERRDGQPWTVDEAAYVSFAGKRAYVPVVRSDARDAEALESARGRLVQVLDGIHQGEFPPRPHDPMICRSCAFSTVCRKDYVEDD